MAPLSPNLGTRCGWMVSAMPQLFYPQEEPRHLFQQAGWAPEPIWMVGEEKLLASARYRTLDCPARSESPYQLHYPGTFKAVNTSDYTAGVVIYTSSGSHASEGNLEMHHELIKTQHHVSSDGFLSLLNHNVSFSYESQFFKKSFKTPFSQPLVQVQYLNIVFSRYLTQATPVMYVSCVGATPAT